MAAAKRLRSSRTIGINGLIAVLTAVPALLESEQVKAFFAARPEYAIYGLYAMSAIGVLNVVLRLVTRQPVDVSGLLTWLKSVPPVQRVAPVVDSPLPQEPTKGGGWSTGAMLLSALLGAGGTYWATAPTAGPPTPEPDAIDTLIGPNAPVVRGELARFETPGDATQLDWVVIEQPEDVAGDPPHDVSDVGRTAHVSTDRAGRYRVLVSGLRGTAPYLGRGELVVKADDSPPAPPAPPKPEPPDEPGPDPPSAATVKQGYFVLLDSWLARTQSDDLQSLGPESKLWAGMRADGHKVVNFDVGSEIAVETYQSYLTDAPVLLVFDRDRGNKFVEHVKVKSIGDVRAAVKKLTGKEYP